ncbi:MAG: hypothetical protein ACTS7D_01625 [Candidatus Hodgkinia cicadicola]
MLLPNAPSARLIDATSGGCEVGEGARRTIDERRDASKKEEVAC